MEEEVFPRGWRERKEAMEYKEKAEANAHFGEKKRVSREVSNTRCVDYQEKGGGTPSSVPPGPRKGQDKA